jgi:hypothetical protein
MPDRFERLPVSFDGGFEVAADGGSNFNLCSEGAYGLESLPIADDLGFGRIVA